MKYTTEHTKYLTDSLAAGISVADMALHLEVPDRSVIAKLASMGLYKKKEYTNKQGDLPIKKEIYIERIAKLLGVEADRLESLEKANKNVLKMLETALLNE